MKSIFFLALVLLFTFSCTTRKTQHTSNAIASTTPAQSAAPKKVMVGDVELHYIERGQGEPLILLHGGQGDYRSWPKQIEALASRYRVISYSRRYHFPNNNTLTSTNHSALIEAADLAGFIDQLKLGPVHLVGTSYGAFTALAFAIDHPQQVRSMALAEPPVLQWAKNTERGAALYNEFMTTAHDPAGKAFAAGDDEGAMRLLIDRFDGPGAFNSLPAERRTVVMQNFRFFKAVTTSSDPFPNLSRDKVKQLHMPVLLIRGENTKELDIVVSDELASVIPNVQRSVIPKAGHTSFRQNPEAFNAAVLEFLGRKGN